MIPERLGKALAGVRPRLAPVLKLRGSLVTLVLRVQPLHMGVAVPAHGRTDSNSGQFHQNAHFGASFVAIVGPLRFFPLPRLRTLCFVPRPLLARHGRNPDRFEFEQPRSGINHGQRDALNQRT